MPIGTCGNNGVHERIHEERHLQDTQGFARKTNGTEGQPWGTGQEKDGWNGPANKP